MRRLDGLLTESASRHPARMAVEDPERRVTVSYADAEAQVADIAEWLRSRGVGAGDRVGVCAQKSAATMLSLLGIMRAGAAYVPVDAAAPVKRQAFIFQDCGVKAIVADRGLAPSLQAEMTADRLPVLGSLEGLAGLGGELVVLGVSPGDTDDAARDASLSYILYTSGSTGQPKGVIHTHASALSFVDWCSEMFAPGVDDRFSSHAPFHFDLSILDLYVPIKHGAAVVLVGDEAAKNPAKLAQLIAGSQMTAWYSTPSILRLLLQYGNLGSLDCSTLRLVLFAGEVFPVKYLRELKAIWTRPVYYNLYGPTETNVCTYYRIPDRIDEDRTEPFPIGYTCSNDRSRIVDANGRDVAPGQEGELCVSGGSVMQGYWNLADRTALAFMTDEQGTKWYKTGDIVRDAGGTLLEFLGRRDRMVKRRGYRVELGEIEAALYQHPSVSEAAVIAVPDQADGIVIRAFVAWTAEQRPSVIEMKGFCSRSLPLYMIPDQFSFESSLPKTSTDKIDYQKLAGASRPAR
jgi:amino acid adenylation domain-containing protein